MKIGKDISGAIFNDSSRKYRYALWRIWQPTGHRLLFIGLNPSTANDIKDDPTIRRLIGFAKAWDFGGLFVGNLFSLVTSNPDVLWNSSPIELPKEPNDDAIKKMREHSSMVLVGWGNEGRHDGARTREVLALLGEPVFCLKTTKVGEPGHPLYMPLTSLPIIYKESER